MDSEQASLGIGLPSTQGTLLALADEAPLSANELSTASLDGAENAGKSSISGIGTASTDSGSAVDNGAPASASAPAVRKTRYFIQPTSGYDWGVLHNNNAVDIANSCGTPVVAAAAGTVIDDPNYGSGEVGWNGGYGDFILIQHPNGTKTRYAHLSRIEVGIGQKVDQGQEIGEIGNTGHVQGETGCHLHFEVIGASNPFAKS